MGAIGSAPCVPAGVGWTPTKENDMNTDEYDDTLEQVRRRLPVFESLLDRDLSETRERPDLVDGVLEWQSGASWDDGAGNVRVTLIALRGLYDGPFRVRVIVRMVVEAFNFLGRSLQLDLPRYGAAPLPEEAPKWNPKNAERTARLANRLFRELHGEAGSLRPEDDGSIGFELIVARDRDALRALRKPYLAALSPVWHPADGDTRSP